MEVYMGYVPSLSPTPAAHYGAIESRAGSPYNLGCFLMRFWGESEPHPELDSLLQPNSVDHELEEHFQIRKQIKYHYWSERAS